MKLEFWGVRGSVPVSGSDRNKYGGNTPCASLFTSDAKWIIVDAGTGIKKLGDQLMRLREKEPMEVHVLLTHFHLDHIMGIPFFGPLYSPEVTLNFYSTLNPEEAEECLSGLMAGRYFPLKFEKTSSQKVFIKIPEENLLIGDISVSCCPLQHPQGSVSFRIQKGEQSIVFATDTEHPERGRDARLVSFARAADILIYDAMFTPEEYESNRRGWGHSTWLEGTNVAKEAGVRHLYLSHFNPDHSDKKIDEIISHAREKFTHTYGAREEVLPVF